MLDKIRYIALCSGLFAASLVGSAAAVDLNTPYVPSLRPSTPLSLAGCRGLISHKQDQVSVTAWGAATVAITSRAKASRSTRMATRFKFAHPIASLSPPSVQAATIFHGAQIVTAVIVLRITHTSPWQGRAQVVIRPFNKKPGNARLLILCSF